VYPSELPRRAWFADYARRFDTVELNATFYRLPDRATVDRWAAQAPPGFVYAVKVGQFGTHRKKLRDAATWLPNHLDRAERLGSALGPNLLQLPPRWRRDVGRLADLLAVAPRRLRWAVEVRDRSWLHEDVLALLADHNAALCVHDLLEDHPWELTADWTYLRFHGPDAVRNRYHGGYPIERLEEVAARLAAWLDAGVDVYAYFNNDHHGHAVVDATTLRSLLG
jgi:uncharacterized protein YecE (DUF72 family)